MELCNISARDCVLRGLKGAPSSRVYDDLRVWRSRDGRFRLDVTTSFERRYYLDGDLVHIEPAISAEQLSRPDYPRAPE